MSVPILTLITLLPLGGALLVGLLKDSDARVVKGVGVAASTLTFLVSLALLPGFRVGFAGFQAREYLAWLPELGINYNIGVDGISLFLVLLTTLLMPLLLLAAWNSIDRKPKAFMIAALVLETAIIGAFVHLNLFFFFVFWEAMLIPMVLIIGVWGSGNRIKSAIKFFLFTAVGSLLMLVAILVLYRESALQLGYYSFNLTDLLGLQLSTTQQVWLFLAFALAFAIKIPLFPLHTWLPDAHVDAPTPGSVVLAGVLLKLGTYGLLRFAMPLFPEGAALVAPWMVGLAVVGIIYAALVAWVQQDMKKLIAYSSVSHMGFVVLGMFVMESKAATGAVLQMVGHGLSTGALFLLVGMIYERRHTREIDAYGGLASVMPVYATMFLIATLSSIGLPGLNGFVGEFLILLGSFEAEYKLFSKGASWTVMLPAILATTGVILGAVYMLTLYLRLFFGRVTNPENQGLKDLSPREWIVILPLVACMFWIGIQPGPLLKRIEPSVKMLYERRMKQPPAKPLPKNAAELDSGVEVVRTGQEAEVDDVAVY